MLAVLPALILAPSATVTCEVTLASLAARDSAICLELPPGLGVLSMERSVLVLIPVLYSLYLWMRERST